MKWMLQSPVLAKTRVSSVRLCPFPLLPRWSPDYSPTFPFRRFIWLNAPIYPYLGTPPAPFVPQTGPDPEIGTADVYKTKEPGLRSHYQSLQYNGIT